MSITDIVYLRTALERQPGMITGVVHRWKSTPVYMVSWGDRTESEHFECELTTEYVPDFAGAAEAEAE